MLKRQKSEKCGDRGGFTLLEILVALVVMTVGLLGVLALFPVSFSRVNETVRESQASAIAESFHQALVVGMHSSTDDVNNDGNVDNKEGVVVLRHAGLLNKSDSEPEKYVFPLPPPPPSGDPIKSYAFPWPEGVTPSPFDDVDDPAAPWGYDGTGNKGDVELYYSGMSHCRNYIWQFGQVDDGQPANDLYDLIRNIKGKDAVGVEYDRSFDLDAYSVSILVQRTGPEPIFRVIIAVYRHYRGRPNFDPDPGGNPYDTSQTHPDLIKEYRALIAGG